MRTEACWKMCRSVDCLIIACVKCLYSVDREQRNTCYGLLCLSGWLAPPPLPLTTNSLPQCSFPCHDEIRPQNIPL